MTAAWLKVCRFWLVWCWFCLTNSIFVQPGVFPGLASAPCLQGARVHHRLLAARCTQLRPLSTHVVPMRALARATRILAAALTACFPLATLFCSDMYSLCLSSSSAQAFHHSHAPPSSVHLHVMGSLRTLAIGPTTDVPWPVAKTDRWAVFSTTRGLRVQVPGLPMPLPIFRMDLLCMSINSTISVACRIMTCRCQLFDHRQGTRHSAEH